MRILIVTNSLSGGGAERAMNLLANQFFDRGIDVVVAPLNAGAPDGEIILAEVMEINRLWRGGLAETVSSIFRFRKIMTEENFDIAILNCDLPELFGIFLPLETRLIAVEHSFSSWKGRRALGFVVRVLLRMRKTSWVKVNPNLKIWPWASSNSVLIRNLFSNLGAKIAQDNSQRLVFIGRLSPEKDPHFFLEIVKHSKMNALIIGDGVLFEEIKLKISRDKLPVSLAGHLPSPWERVTKGDLLLLTSSSEGDGLVLLEAVSLDVPFLVKQSDSISHFNLPRKVQADSLAGFLEKITSSSNFAEDFRITPQERDALLRDRSFNEIINKWIDLINLVSKSH